MPIQAFFIPRNIIRETIKDRQELSWNGVYTLFDSVNTNNKTIYIGEAENIGHRLIQHDIDKENWWNIALAFVVNNERHQLSKADIKFLENIMYTKASQAGIMKIYNGNMPHQSFVSEERVYDLKEIFFNIDLLLRSLGFPAFFNPLKHKSNNEREQLVYFTGRGSRAVAKYTAEGMIVQRGSKLSPKEPSPTFTSLKKLRTLEKEGVIKNDIFTRDYIFDSPSGAGVIIYKARCNGWNMWRTRNGKTLNDLYR